MPNPHSLFQPLQQKRFCQLWFANLLSNLGNWSQTFALTWQVSNLAHSNVKTSLVQTALWAPMFIFAVPAGQLADTMPKPQLLFMSNLVACFIAFLLWLLSASDVISVNMLLWLCVLSGTANAFTLPAWQTSMSELVGRPQLSPISSLNNLSFNLAACIAPFFAGIVVLWLGPSPVYLFNAFSFCGLLIIYYRWQSQLQKLHEVPTASPPDLLQGVQQVIQLVYARKSVGRLMWLTFVVFFLCSAIPALLPSFNNVDAASSIHYGTKMSLIGGGAVIAALFVPRLRMYRNESQILTLSLSIYGLMLVALAVLSSARLSMIVLFTAGIAWSGIVTSFNSAALSVFPLTLRARGLSMYILINAAGQASGGLIWGQLADATDVQTSAIFAGVALLCCAVFVRMTQEFLEP